MYLALFLINIHADRRIMYNFLTLLFNLKEKTAYDYSAVQHAYPFPDSAAQIGLL